jgi:hypothetical protein
LDEPAAGARPGTRAVAGLTVFIALHLALFWSVTYLPTQDGPVHKYNASLQGALAAPASTTLREYYELRPAALANTFSQQALAVLMAATSPETGERLFVSLYLVLFAGGAWYLVACTRPENRPLVVLWVPFALTYLFHMGFYGFCFGAATSLVLFGYWTHRRSRFGPGHAAVAAGLSLLVCLWHPFAFVVTLLVIGIAVTGSAAARAAAAGRASRPALRSGVLWPLVSAMPALVLLMASAREQGGASGALLQRPWQMVQQLRRPPLWVSFVDLEWVPWLLVIVALIVTVAALVVRKIRRGDWIDLDALLVAAGVLGALFFVAPDTMPGGGGLIHARLIWCLALVLLWWIASQRLERRLRSALVGIGLVCGLALLGIHLRSYIRADRLLTEYATALAAVPPHTSLLGLSTADRGDYPDRRIEPLVLPMLHAAALVGTGRDVALVANYQANRPFFPVRFRDGRNPVGEKYNHERFPFQAVDLDSYEGPSGLRIDAIVLWGRAGTGRGQGPYDTTLEQIAQRYTRTFVSSPRGMAQVWRRRESVEVRQPVGK